MTLEDLLEEARRVGTVESAGSFTLDFQAAVAKLRGFQLENQYHYVNRLIRAASLAGAREVDIRTDSSKTRVEFPALAVEPENLPRLFEEMFQNQRPAARELATAVNLAVALKPQRIEVQVGSKVFSLEGQKGDLYDVPRQAAGTIFQLTRSRTSQLSQLGTHTPEFLAIVKRFRYSPLRLRINNESLKGWEMWGAPRDPSVFAGDTVTIRPAFWSLPKRFFVRHHALEARYFHPDEGANCVYLGASRATRLLGEDGRPCYLAFGLRVDPKAASTASFVYEGEILQKFPVKLPLSGVELVISAHGLPLDLSGEQLRQGEDFEERWAQAKRHFQSVHEALVRTYGKNPVKALLFAPQRLAVEPGDLQLDLGPGHGGAVVVVAAQEAEGGDPMGI